MENTQTATSPAAAPAQPRATLTLTAQAVAQVKQIIRAQGFEGHYLSVRVVPAGCSGFGYDLNLVKDIRQGDLVWEQEGIQIATDEMSAQYLTGTEVDYVTGLHGSGFKFNNPNAKSSCGCGNSFSV
ncbi:MAG: iron-sulfur cluster assembly accessory protein [Myxococcaceae bacterium]|nr:iron-sulfur cluster assembly accessory protein [Myxococcaceae bacterium]